MAWIARMHRPSIHLDAPRTEAAHLTAFVEHAPAAVAMFDRDMRYLAVSRRWAEDYRLGDQPLLGRSHYDVFPNIPDEWKATHQRALAGAVERRNDDRWRPIGWDADQWLTWEVRPWFDAGGAIGGIMMLTQDVTAIRWMERTLAERNGALALAVRENQQLAQAVEATGDAVYVLDLAGRIGYVNGAFERATGWSRAAIKGQSPAVLEAEPRDAEAYAALWARLAAGETWMGRLRNARPDPRARLRVLGGVTPTPDRYWVDTTLTPITDDNEAVIGFVAVQRDVSAQVAHEESERRAREGAEARLAVARALETDAPLTARFDRALAEVFAIRDLDVHKKGGVFLLEEGASTLRMFHHRGAFSEAFLRDEAEVPVGTCLCGRAAETGRIIVSDDCFEDPRHERSWPNMAAHGHYIVPLMHAGQCLGVLFLYTNVHPVADAGRMELLEALGELMTLAVVRQRAAQLLIEAREKAEAATRAKSEFLATMSHEIRTPMNGLLGFAELLASTRLDREQQEFVETIRASGQTLLALLNDILDFSKIEAGKLTVESAPFDLRQVVDSAVELVSSQADERRIELAVSYPAAAPRKLTGDSGRVRQVLMNLLGNAIKFTAVGHVLVEITDEGGAVRLAVRDTGVGIAPDKHASLFTKFSQADASTTRRFGGTGLGLAISKHLVELMGGQVGLESVEGVGSTFWFTLPAPSAPQHASGGPGAPVHSLPPGPPPRVLVVERAEVNRRVLEQQAAAEGAQVVGVADLDAAQRALSGPERAFEFVMVDAGLPAEGALELASLVLSRPAAQRPMLILLAHRCQQADGRRWSDVGYAHVLRKPLGLEAPFQSICATLRRERRRAAERTPSVKPVGPASPAVRRRVLVAEDNLTNQKLAMHFLERLGCDVDVASNGREAVELVALRPYDVVFMDCSMPEMDGYQATERIRALGGSRRIPIVALTANAMSEDRERCIDAGMDDFISKPMRIQSVNEALTRWAPQS